MGCSGPASEKLLSSELSFVTGTGSVLNQQRQKAYGAKTMKNQVKTADVLTQQSHRDALNSPRNAVRRCS